MKTITSFRLHYGLFKDGTTTNYFRIFDNPTDALRFCQEAIERKGPVYSITHEVSTSMTIEELEQMT